MKPMLDKLHHIAYRCNDARETTEFYTKALGLKFRHALSNDFVPSVKRHDPHIHLFFEMADGSFIAFFETPITDPSYAQYPNATDWAPHLALEVKDMDALMATKKRLEDNGVDVIGPVDHHFCKSIYFFDPSGNRLEATIRCEQEGELDKFEQEAWGVLDKWEQRKRAENWPTRKPALAAAAE